MQPGNVLYRLQDSMGDFLPSLIGAIAILLVGWILAAILGSLTRKALDKLGLNDRLAKHTNSDADFQKMGGRLVFWVVLLMALIAALNVLKVAGVTGPLTGLVMTLVPAIVLAVVAWLVATIVRVVINKALSATTLDEKISDNPGAPKLSHTMGDVAYWLVLLLFLPAIVGVLGIEALTQPLSNMISELVGMLPNLIAAAIIGVVGWIIAKVIRGVVTNLVAATGVDRYSESSDTTSGIRLSQLAGTLAFILVIVPTLIAALDALRIEAISAPLTAMLDKLLLAVPNVLAAAAILLLAWFIGRFVSQLAAELLASMGLDRLPERLGLGHAFASHDLAERTDYTVGSTGDVATTGGSASSATASGTASASGGSLSQLVGKVLLFFIMLFATVEAAGLLGFGGVNELLASLIVFGGDILLGLVIFAVGYWLADLAGKALLRASPDAQGMARIARFAILGLVVAMGLGAMGVADDIVSLAFGLVLGAIAVAVALAFGLGGREAAGQVASRWASKYLGRS